MKYLPIHFLVGPGGPPICLVEISGPEGGDIREISGPGGGIKFFLYSEGNFRPAKPAETSQKIRGSPRNLQKTGFWKRRKWET